MSPFFLKRMLRSPGKHIGILLVSLVLAALLCFLAGYREKQERSRRETVASEEVLCVVTDISGTRSDHLKMGYGAAQAVTLEAYGKLPAFVSDIRMTKDLIISIEGVGADIALTAVTSPKGLVRLDPSLGAELTLMREDFFTSDESLIIVSEEAFGLLGDAGTLRGFVTDPFIDRSLFPDEPTRGTGEQEFTVAGYYRGKGEEAFMPFDAAMELTDRISGTRSVDSIAFLAKDNERLDELREAAGKVFGTVDPEGSSGKYRFALTVHDEALTEKLAAFDQNLRRTECLIPAALALTLAAGLLMGFIATRSEKNAYALARSVGLTKKRLLASSFAEQLALPLLACLIMGAVFRRPLAALLVLALYALGCLIAVLRAASVSPSKLLREQE